MSTLLAAGMTEEELKALPPAMRAQFEQQVAAQTPAAAETPAHEAEATDDGAAASEAETPDLTTQTDPEGSQTAETQTGDATQQEEAHVALVQRVSALEAELQRERQKNATLQAKYRKDIPAMQQQMQKRLDALAAMEQRLKEREQELERKGAEAAQQDPKAYYGLEDGDEFDPVKATIKVVGKEVGKLREELKNLRTAPETPAEESLGDEADADAGGEADSGSAGWNQFMQTVRLAVPDFDAINTSAPWLAWLDANDPTLGVKRQDLLNEAAAVLNAQRVVGMLRAYKASQAAQSQAAEQKRKTIASQAMPDMGPGSKTKPASETEKPMTEAEAMRLREDISKGRITGAELEAVYKRLKI